APAPSVSATDHAFRARATYTAPESGRYVLTLVQAGRARVLVDGAVVLDGVTDPPPAGDEFFGAGSQEIGADLDLTAGQTVAITVEFTTTLPASFLTGAKVGLRLPSPADLIDRAVAAAGGADAVVVVVGTNSDWETEGRDRETLALPGDQDELVRRVAAGNSRTVVCVNTGAPVTADWCDDVGAIVLTWFGGQEMADALVDVLTGAADPGGRLPTTWPLRLEHNPSFGNFPGEHGEVRYGEGLLVGYRWYDSRSLP